MALGMLWAATCSRAEEPLDAADQSARLPPALARTIDFRREVYPLLAKRCFACHQGEETASGSRLDNYDHLIGAAGQRPLVVPGKSGASTLVHLIAGLVEGKEMPQEGPPLTNEEIGLLRAWIDQGAAWDFGLLPRIKPIPPERHWAFQVVVRPEIPTVADAAWIRNPIDRFIAARQAALGVKPVEEAAPHTLVRRLWLDLLGLPPPPEEVNRFAHSSTRDSQSALELSVERLLASRIMASAGPVIGWMWPAGPRRKATKATIRAISPGAIGTG
jgi:hypothetical protein